MAQESKGLDRSLTSRTLAPETINHARKAPAADRSAPHRSPEIRLLAERRAGELLRELQRADPKDRNPAGSNQHQVSGNDGRKPTPYAEALDRTGTNERTARRWQQLAEVPKAYVRKASRKERPAHAIIGNVCRAPTCTARHPGATESPHCRTASTLFLRGLFQRRDFRFGLLKPAAYQAQGCNTHAACKVPGNICLRRTFPRRARLLFAEISGQTHGIANGRGSPRYRPSSTKHPAVRRSRTINSTMRRVCANSGSARAPRRCRAVGCGRVRCALWSKAMRWTMPVNIGPSEVAMRDLLPCASPTRSRACVRSIGLTSLRTVNW
jgi:hypothetical protein